VRDGERNMKRVTRRRLITVAVVAVLAAAGTLLSKVFGAAPDDCDSICSNWGYVLSVIFFFAVLGGIALTVVYAVWKLVKHSGRRGKRTRDPR
jgi:multidrug transporter EmrE-like cation transporter